MDKDKIRVVTGLMIIIGVTFIIVAVSMIGFEIYEARSYCKSIGGEYDLNPRILVHYCNGDKIIKYGKEWAVEKWLWNGKVELNWSEIE